jgi:uncharacterized protein (TIGR02391 family)
MPDLPLPQRMSLSDAISYVIERCKRTPQRASRTIHLALGEGTLQPIANRVVRDPDQPRHSRRTIETGLHPVPVKVWSSCSWPAFYKRSLPSSLAWFREQTAGGEGTGPVWRNPTIATADIDVWLSREGNQDDRVVRAYRDLDLHPVIGEAASKLYLDGHYASAIVGAVNSLNNLVRKRSGSTLDGMPLMQKVFSPNAPTLQFNPMSDQNDKDEQQGFMMMFAGAVAALRDPRANKLIKDDPEQALEFIAFVSLLAKLLDGAKKA